MTDERLKQLYEQALARREHVDRERCASPETLIDLLERRGPEHERLRVLDHVIVGDGTYASFREAGLL